MGGSEWLLLKHPLLLFTEREPKFRKFLSFIFFYTCAFSLSTYISVACQLPLLYAQRSQEPFISYKPPEYLLLHPSLSGCTHYLSLKQQLSSYLYLLHLSFTIISNIIHGKSWAPRDRLGPVSGGPSPLERRRRREGHKLPRHGRRRGARQEQGALPPRRKSQPVLAWVRGRGRL